MPPSQAGQLAQILVHHRDLVDVFDPVDAQGDPIENVGLDGFDIISVRVSNSNDPRTLRVFWSSEMDFFTGPASVLGAGVSISHGDLLTNAGSIWRNALFVSPFGPADAMGIPITDDLGLDAVNVIGVKPLVFDQFASGVQSSLPFGLHFSFEEQASGGVDSFVSTVLAGLTVTHGDALEYQPIAPQTSIFRTQDQLVAVLNGAGTQHGLDAFDVLDDEQFETGPFDTSTLDPVLFSVEETESLSGAEHGDLLGEVSGRLRINPSLTGDPTAREFGLDGLDVLCFEPVPLPINVLLIILNAEHPGMSYDLNNDGIIDASDLLKFGP